MGKLLKIGNPNAHYILSILNVLNKYLHSDMLNFSLDKDNLYLSEENIEEKIYNYSKEYFEKNELINNFRKYLDVLIKEAFIKRESFINIDLNNQIVSEFFKIYNADDYDEFIKNRKNNIREYDIANLNSMINGIIDSGILYVYTFNLWNRYKQIYNIFENIEENFDYDNKFILYSNIFKSLPYNSIYIEYPKNIQNELSENDDVSHLGVFVSYLPVESKDKSYPDKKIKSRLIIVYIGLVKESNSPFIANYFLSEEDIDNKSIKDVINNILKKYPISTNRDKNNLFGNRKKMYKLLSFVIQSILYLCSTDITTNSNYMPKSRIPNNKQITITEIGFNEEEYNKLIEESYIIEEQDIRIVNDKNRTKSTLNNKEYKKSRKPCIPHWVRMHWHSYWVGKGKTELILKRVGPYLKGKDRIDTKLTTVVKNKYLDI